MGSAPLDQFGPAVEAVRSVLRDLDDDQIPADLRKVAAYAGGSLPPPLAAAALKALDRYAWLREKAAAVFGANEDSPSGLIIYRSPGWSVALAARVSSAVASAAAGSVQADRKRIAGLEAKVESVKQAMRAKAAESDGEIRRLRDALEAEKATRRSAQAADARVDAAAGRRVGELEDGLSTTRVDLERATSEVDRLSAVERELRRDRAALEAALAEATTGPGWIGGDPAAFALHLDELAVMGRVRKTAQADDHTPDAPEGLPAGVRPDRREAVDWMLTIEGAVTVIIDGYNVGFHLIENRNPTAARRRLGIEVDRLARLAPAPMRFVVVYDSSHDPSPPPPAVPGPEIRFTEAGLPADEEIARLAAVLDGTIVVISSDRWVREVAEASGAIALWSEAVVGWTAAR